MKISDLKDIPSFIPYLYKHNRKFLFYAFAAILALLLSIGCIYWFFHRSFQIGFYYHPKELSLWLVAAAILLWVCKECLWIAAGHPRGREKRP